MIPGDMPCGATCHNARCPWCSYGTCMDNCVCEHRMQDCDEGDRE